eukprot:UN10033
MHPHHHHHHHAQGYDDINYTEEYPDQYVPDYELTNTNNNNNTNNANNTNNTTSKNYHPQYHNYINTGAPTIPSKSSQELLQLVQQMQGLAEQLGYNLKIEVVAPPESTSTTSAKPTITHETPAAVVVPNAITGVTPSEADIIQNDVDFEDDYQNEITK